MRRRSPHIQRNANIHDGTLSWPVTIYSNGASVGFDYGLCDCQSQARASYPMKAGLVGTIEAFEDVGKVCGVDAGPVVFDRYDHSIVSLDLRPDHNVSAGLGVLNRVPEHVSQCLAHPHQVEFDDREIARYLQRQFNLLGLGLRLPAFRLCGQQVVDRT